MIVRPSAEPSLAPLIAAGLADNTSVRFGTVVSHSATGLLVALGGGLIPAAFLSSYEPFVGDEVAVIRQESTWLVLGAMGTPVGNLTAVANYSFEDGEPETAPPSWTLSVTAGSAALTTELWPREDFVDGDKVGRLTATGTGTITCEVVSLPIPVLEGELWSASAMVIPSDNFGPGTVATVELRIGWYETDDVATLLDTSTSGAYAIARGAPWRQIRTSSRRGYMAIAGTSFLRVKLAFSWAATAGEYISFDRFLARRIS